MKYFSSHIPDIRIARSISAVPMKPTISRRTNRAEQQYELCFDANSNTQLQELLSRENKATLNDFINS